MTDRNLQRHIGAALLLGAVFLATGCRQRTLEWHARDPQPLKNAGRVADEDPQMPSGQGPAGQVVSATANHVATAFMQRNYRVTFIPKVIQPPTLDADGMAIDPEETTHVPPAGRPKGALDDARDTEADLLVETTLTAMPHMTYEPMYGPPYSGFGVYAGSGGYYGAWTRSYPWGWPRYVDRYDVSYSLIVEAASLRITEVATGEVLATVTVRYDVREDDPADIAADLMMGVDAILQGRPSGSMELETAPGQWPENDEEAQPAATEQG
jgi:hypothetical protein